MEKKGAAGTSARSDGREKVQKYISECGVMSRRAAEKEIAAGRVSINGVRAEIGAYVDPTCDTVTVAGKAVRAEGKKTYIMLNKPVGVITTLSDESGRRCVAELVRDAGVRLNPVGRLDKNSEGLLLLTNDGELLNRLTHPRYSLPKLYKVTVGGEVSPEQLSALCSPMVIDGYRLRPVECTVIEADKSRTVLSMTLHEGRNRQIRKMCASVGLGVSRLQRVAVGKLRLGALAVGEWKYLSREQVTYLRRATGLE